MKSLIISSISNAIPTPTKLSIINTYTTIKLSCPSNHKLNEKSSYVPKQPQQHHCSKLSRREAIGLIGFLAGGAIGIADPLLQREANAATAETCELTVAPSGLGFCDKVVGTGPEAVKGQLIKAHYVGKLENGKVFDSSYNRGKPLTFRVGVGEAPFECRDHNIELIEMIRNQKVIKGWDEGILGGEGVPPMQAGGKRTLKLPPELGYGMRGAGCKGGSCIIPPDSVLLFDVELLK